MTRLWFCVVAATLRVSLQCANMPGDTTCGRAVIHAMTHDFVLHPDQFIGLSVKSSYTEFQAYFHNSGMHNCPRPCLEMEQACVPWSTSFPGIAQIKDMRFQMAQHPDWWPELSSKSSDKEISKALYTRGAKGIPRVCEADEAPGHHVEYAEAASDDTTDSTRSDSVEQAIQELMDRRKDRANENGGAEDGWASAESMVTSPSASSEETPNEVKATPTETFTEEKPTEPVGTFTEEKPTEPVVTFTEEKPTEKEETYTKEEKEVEESSAEEVHENAKASSEEEASSEEGTEESKETSAEESPEEAKEVSTEEKSEEKEEVSTEETSKGAEDDTSWLDSWKGEDSLDGSAGDGEESGTSHESGSSDSDHEVLEWPSHQDHQVQPESQSEDESNDGLETSGGEDVNSGAPDALVKGTECFHKGRSFSMLDVPQHNPESVADAQTCQAQCIEMGAAHFLFHEPTELCHCPPAGAIPMEVGSEFVSGDVSCISSGILGKSEVNVPRLGNIGLNVTPGLMALAAFSMLAVAVPATAFCRKISRAQRLNPSSGFSRLDPLMADLEEARGFTREAGPM